jgi:HSP20 family protein
MAKNDVNTNEQQSQQAGQSQGKSVATSSRQQGVAQHKAYDPFGFPLAPFSFLGLNPFSLMGRLLEQVDYGARGTENTGMPWVPAIEVTERDGNLVVRAELPGVKPENVRVEARDGALIIEGESRCEREEDVGGIHRSERRYGRFFRSIPLPEGAKVDQARASLENGVLEITVPVQQQQSSNQRQIPVQASSSAAGESSKKPS